MSVLITRPEHDPTTKHLAHWSQAIVDMAVHKGFDVFDLRRASANRTEFIGRMKKLQPRFVILNGHGDEETVAGHDNEPLIEADVNEDLLYNRITYAVSCNSAAELGVHCSEHPCTTFIGYTDKFIFSLTRSTSSRPLQDVRARPFMESSNQVALALLKGHTAAEASQKSKELFQKNYRSLLSSTSNPDALHDAQLLWWDMMHQVCLGYQEATVMAQKV